MEDQPLKRLDYIVGSECTTLVQLLRWRASLQSDQKAYTFLSKGEEELSLTYAELDRQSRAIGAMLQRQGAIGERVLLLYPAGLEYIAAFFGCLYAGALAVPAYPPHSNRSLERIESIVADAQAKFVLTTSQIISKLSRGSASLHVPDLQALQWIATDRESTDKDETRWQMPEVTGSTIAFLQYTSGSTATPKGVMVSHSNLLSNHRMIQSTLGHPVGVPFVSWLPLFHDMGLISKMLQALYVGSPCILLPPSVFLQSPFRWLEAISRYQAHSSGAPNFAYDLCVEKITPEQRDTLDLSSWKVAFCGAEPVRYQTLTRFAAYFAPCGFRVEALKPVYGLAEATAFVTGHRSGQPPVAHRLKKEALEQHQVILADRAMTGQTAQADEKSVTVCTSCGRTELDARVVIVDPETGVQCSAETIGEIWVAGSHVAQGYWNHPDETERTFRAYIKDTGEGPFLRTEDLGFLLDGDLFITGRLKDVIIIQGRNHYPQDIEQTVQQCHSDLRSQSGAAFSIFAEDKLLGQAQELHGQAQERHGQSQELLVIVQEVQRECRSQEELDHVCRAIRRAVTEQHDIAVHGVTLIRYGSVPKTSSGKIQRRACRSRFLDGSLNVVYQWVQSAMDAGARPVSQDALPTHLEERYAGRSASPKESLADIANWLVARVAALASVNPSEIDTLRPFSDYGLGSASAISVAGDLERWLGCSLPPTLLYDYPTISALAHYLQGQLSGESRNERLAEHLLASQSLRREKRATRTEPIAIIGLGCRFPGADSPEAFWQMLHDGIDGISEIPATRWNAAQFYAKDPATPGKMNTRWGGFLPNIERFDPAFFHISPREAEVIDPQQRLLLEVAWETFEQAGLVPEKLVGGECGVFVGVSSHDYYTLHHAAPDYHQAYTGTGNAQSIAANRLSYFFDFHGPSMAIDTACSSSLVAVHQACQSLRNGECNLALAGGVNVILTPELTVSFSQARTISSDGRCKTFDETADGYVRSEGCGVVLLKPLADALRDGNSILALIRGSAVNQDGQSNGLTAPSGSAQEAVIRRALQHACVSPDDISYVETHGSSTPLGDPIEMNALKAVLMRQRRLDQPCILGAVKTNIGHLEAAAGIAGLIKTVLCLQKGVIVPNLHFNRLNPHISFAGTTFEIPTEPRQWPGPQDAPHFAGVSAFGFGGTNVHLIIERALTAKSLQEVVQTGEASSPTSLSAQHLSKHPLHLLTLSARTDQALLVLAQRYRDFLVTHPTISLSDLCFTANTGRTHFSHRLAVYAENTQQMDERLATFVAGQIPPEMQLGQRETRQRPIVFLFPGQGCQYVNMARQLYETEPTFRKALNECNRILHSLHPQEWSEDQDRHGARSLLSVLYPVSGVTSPIDETAHTQPALFALEYALAQMWLSWGIKPDAVMGHSMGEYVAACIAGLFSLEDGLKLITARARLMQALPEHGAMAVIFAAPEHIQPFVKLYEQHVSIAALNGPQNTVISGQEEFVRLIVQRLQRFAEVLTLRREGEPQNQRSAKGSIFLRTAVETERIAAGVIQTESVVLPISQASHCPLVDPMLDAFELIAREVTFLPLQIPLVCNLTGQLLGAGETLDANYWRCHTREPVQFATSIQTLAANGYELFLEVGPTPVLSKMGRRCQPAKNATWLSSLHQDYDDWHMLLQCIASLYCKGCNLNWSSIDCGGIHHTIALPTYPFERERCWFESKEMDGDVGRMGGVGAGVPTNARVPIGEASSPTYPTTPTLPPASPLTTYIQAQIAHILHQPVQRLECEQPLTSLGFDSLMAIELKNCLELDLQIHIPIGTLLQGPSIAQLVNQLLALVPVRNDRRRTSATCSSVILNGELASPMCPLSHNQKALWFLSRLEPESAAYNVLYSARIQQHLDVATLQRVLRKLADRYPVLTSTYTLHNGEPVQQTLPNRTISLEEIDATSVSLDDLKLWLQEESNRPIDLTKGPVFRLKLYRRADDDYVLGFIVHHIAVDFRSLEILLEELAQLYAVDKMGMAEPSKQSYVPLGQALRPQPDFQNVDYVRWQQAMLQSEEGERHWQYWQSELDGELPVLNLPTDRPRPAVQTYKGASHSVSFNTDLVTKLRILANEEKVTLFTLMLTAYQVLLHRYTHQDDLLVGTPALGRTRSEWGRIVSYLANPVILRSKLGPNPTFKELLHQTQRTVLSALEHQDFPFPLLVERLQPHRDPSFSPISQTHFIWDRTRTHIGRDLTHSKIPVPTLSLQHFIYGQQGIPFDLNLTIFEIAGQLSADFRSNVDLFDTATIARMAEHFLTALDSIADNPDQYVREIPLLSISDYRILAQGKGPTIARNTHQIDKTVETMPCPYPPPQDKCIHQTFEQQVTHRGPDAVALAFGEEQALTYTELNRRANLLAHHLRQLSVGPEVLVAICMERSMQMVVGLLAILKAGGAYLPLDPNYPRERLAFMVQEAQVELLLTQHHLHALWDQPAGNISSSHVRVICLDCDWINLTSGANPLVVQGTEATATAPDVTITDQNLAYVIYTSGSTGQPKGVMVTHGNVNHSVHALTSTLHITAQDTYLHTASFSFSSSVRQLLVPLSQGATVVLASHGQISDPLQLFTLIQQRQISVLDLVPSYWHSCVQALLSLECTAREKLLENKVRLLVTASETLPPLLPRQWKIVTQGTSATPATLINMFGQTETTGIVATYPLAPSVTSEQAPQEASVPIGCPIVSCQLYLLDASFQPVPIGVWGEIYVGGPDLARCYLGRPELTAERFVPHPFVGATPCACHNLQACPAGARLYRTGDLARYLPDGNIEYLGRHDLQVKVRGHRVELGEIEAALGTHPAIQEAVVLARKDGSAEKHLASTATQLVAYLVARQGQPMAQGTRAISSDLRSYLQDHLPSYMIPSIYVFLDTWPLTLHGKVDRRALPVPNGEPSDEKDEQERGETQIGELVKELWCKVLGRTQVGNHDNFFALGGHSLLVIQLIAQVRAILGVEIAVRAVFEAPTVAGFAQRVEQALLIDAGIQVPPLVITERPEIIPLSFAQQRLWFLDQLEQDLTAYLGKSALRVEGRLDVCNLDLSLQELIHRHESLRTTFPVSPLLSQPVQMIHPVSERGQAPTLRVIDLQRLLPEQREEEEQRLIRQEGQRPCDLATGPLLRTYLLRQEIQTHVLLLTLHHIIIDAWSNEVLLRELGILYSAFVSGQPSPLAPLPVQYADYALWQRQWFSVQDSYLQSQLIYWRKQLQDLSHLALPTDYPRPAVQTYRGAIQEHWLPEVLSTQLLALSQQENVTLFMTGLAAFQVLLARYTGQSDICVACPVANRRQAEVEGVVGFFVNALVLRTNLGGDPTFGEILRRVREVCLAAYAHQDIPFEKVVEELEPERDLSRSPLFQVMFVLQKTPVRVGQTTLSLEAGQASVKINELTLERTTSKFDLTLFVIETGQGLCCQLEYRTDLFEAKTITRLLANFQTMLEGIVQDPQAHMSDLPLLTQAEREQLLVEWNATKTDYLQDRCVHQLFERQAERTPDTVAVVFEEQQLTYSQLNSQANQLASRLRQVGIGPEQLVGICLERSLELVVALLAVLKAGGAYVPLDPSNPPERFTWILEDAQVPIVITQTSLMPRFLAFRPVCICLDANCTDDAYGNYPSGECETKLVKGLTPENLAYVIYTSGSTGRPKGVMVTHANVSRLFLSTANDFCFQPNDVWTLFHSTAFDFSVWEIWGALLHGGRLVIVPYWVSRSPDQFYPLLKEQQVTVLNQTPSAFRQFMQVEEAKRGDASLKLRLIIFGGEALDLGSLHPWVTVHGDQEPQLINMYGITETTVHVTSRRLFERDVACGAGSPIGRVIPDLQLYILDANRQLVPIGEAGELFVGGAGLARGYLERPELTAERFVPHPFVGIVPYADPGARLYRTGDLVRYHSDGEIEYLGRLDQQVKIRGYRIELGEIEVTLLRHPLVREAVVVVREDVSGEKRLVASVMARMGEMPEAGVGLASILRGYCREQLPDYMVPTFFVLLDALPLLPNGKVDRRALLAPEKSACEHPQGEMVRTPVEEVVSAIYREVLRAEQVGPHESFFDLGGHSLLAVQVISRIRVAMGVELSVRSLFETSSVAGLARQIEGQLRAGKERTMPPLVTMPRKQDLPLSFAQQRLWFMDRLQPESTAYQGTEVLHFHGVLNARVLERSLEKLMHRHEILRTTFAVQAGEPMQVIHPAARYYLPVIDLSGLKQEQGALQARQMARQDARHPCNLDKGPLLRVHLLRLEMQEHRVLLTIHHIITDGWSNEVLMHELTQLYEAYVAGRSSPLAPLPLQYADYALWQREWLQGEVLETQLAYWRKQLAGITPLKLSVNRPHLSAESQQAGTSTFVVPTHLCEALKRLSSQEQVTGFMTFLAAFQILLHYYSGQDDIVVGTDVANRHQVELEGLVGFFVNQLVLRVNLSGNPTFGELLKQVRAMTVQAYVHQDLPFEKLVEALQPQRNAQSTPLFQVKFLFESNTALPKQAALVFSDVVVKQEGVVSETTSGYAASAQTDLLLRLAQKPAEGLIGSFIYKAGLFKQATIERMARDYLKVLETISSPPDMRIDELDIVSEEEGEKSIMDAEKKLSTAFSQFKRVQLRPVHLQQERLIQTSYLSAKEQLPLIIRPQGVELDLIEWAKSNRTFLESELRKYGALLFRDFSVSSPTEFEQFALALCPDLYTENGEHVPADVGSGNLYTPVFYAPEKKLLWHNENSFNSTWPMKIWFFCTQVASNGGETPIADSRSVFERIDPRIREQFMQKGIMYIRNYRDRLGLSWQKVFRTEKKEEVERYCQAAAIDFEWKGKDHLRTRLIRPAVLKHPQTGDWVWWNQATHWHPACLDKEVRTSLLTLFSEEDLPRNCFYGDGSPIEEATMAAICEAYQEAEVSFPWKLGDILMLDNMLTAHARNPYEGSRKIYVSMGGMCTLKDLSVPDFR